jgi:sulfonate transport system substrate-binding protein
MKSPNVPMSFGVVLIFAWSLLGGVGRARDIGGVDLGGVTITIGQQGAETEAIFIESGAFADAPYRVEFARFTSPTETLTALAAGRVDIANNVAQWTATQASAAVTPLWDERTAAYKNVLVNAPGNPEKFERFVVAASAKSGITDIRDAKGKIWGVMPNAAGHLFAAKVLLKLGWTLDDVNIAYLDSTNQSIALQTGSVDLIFNPRDTFLAALQSGARILGDAHQYDYTVYTGYLTNVKSIEDPIRGIAIRDVVLRIIRSMDWFVLNPEKAQEAYRRYLKLTPEQARLTWEYMRFRLLPPSREIADYSQELADIATNFGLLKTKVNARALLDDKFAADIEKEISKLKYNEHLAASYQAR